MRLILIPGALGAALIAASAATAPAPAYTWAKLADSAAYPGAYNFPVFVVRNEMWAFHPDGKWSSRDGKTWTKSSLPASGLNAGYQKYVAFNDAVYSLGTMTGNYLDLHLTTRIQRTRDFKTWDVVAGQSELPRRVFYGAVVFKNKIWLLGGYDGANYHNDVWSSSDAVHWTRVAEHAAWSARDVDVAAVFKDKLWIVGGGVIDGQRDPNPNAKREVWSSADGITWAKSPDRSGDAWGGSPVVFDGKLWMVGANRNSTFAPSTLVTDDGAAWRDETAPWSARGAPAVWVFGSKLYMTGGKYSEMENGRPQFIYRNDVWTLSKSER